MTANNHDDAVESKSQSSSYSESRVLIIMTGGTICMRDSPSGLGLVPATGFMEQAMAPRPSFNDGSICGRLEGFYTFDLFELSSTPVSCVGGRVCLFRRKRG
jgi:L-asparaginase/Glu-tRNA(Gln) amidotransferase subunit D